MPCVEETEKAIEMPRGLLPPHPWLCTGLHMQLSPTSRAESLAIVSAPPSPFAWGGLNYSRLQSSTRPAEEPGRGAVPGALLPVPEPAPGPGEASGGAPAVRSLEPSPSVGGLTYADAGRNGGLGRGSAGSPARVEELRRKPRSPLAPPSPPAALLPRGRGLLPWGWSPRVLGSSAGLGCSGRADLARCRAAGPASAAPVKEPGLFSVRISACSSQLVPRDERSRSPIGFKAE